MEIKVQGDPGTGNTYMELHIGTVQNFNPKATTVINNIYGDRPKAAPATAAGSTEAARPARRDEILDYVLRLQGCVAPQWASRYRTLWETVLSAPGVEAVAYEPGKQQNTTFNRSLVANIIYIMCEQGVIQEQNASRLAELLERDRDHSVRGRLREYPEDRRVRDCVTSIIGTL